MSSKITDQQLAEVIRSSLAHALDHVYDRPDLANEARGMDDGRVLDMYMHWIHSEADAFFTEEEA